MTTPLNQRYRVIQAVTATWCPEGREDVDWMIKPGQGEFSFDGSNILFHPPKEWVKAEGLPDPITTINMNGFIDVMVEHGRLEKV